MPTARVSASHCAGNYLAFYEAVVAAILDGTPPPVLAKEARDGSAADQPRSPGSEQRRRLAGCGRQFDGSLTSGRVSMVLLRRSAEDAPSISRVAAASNVPAATGFVELREQARINLDLDRLRLARRRDLPWRSRQVASALPIRPPRARHRPAPRPCQGAFRYCAA